MFKRFGTAARAAVLSAAVAAAGPASAGVAMIDQVTVGDGRDVAMIQAATSGATTPDMELAMVGGGDGLWLTALDAPQLEPSGRGGRSLIMQDGGLDGGSLFAEVVQSAPDAQSVILQSGSFNTALVYQTVNAGSVSTIVQSGNGNTAIVRQ